MLPKDENEYGHGESDLGIFFWASSQLQVEESFLFVVKDGSMIIGQ